MSDYTDPRVEAVAEALHASEHAGEMTRSCPAWDDAAIAVAALDAHDNRVLADLMVARYGKEPVLDTLRATNPETLFDAICAVIEADLRERIAQDIEAMPYPEGFDGYDGYGGFDDAQNRAARIVRGQA